MIEKVRNTVEKYHMANTEESVLCCLSGGADSVALLLCLHEIFPQVRACHINHQLRGGESLRDERYCVEICQKLGVPLEVRRVDAKDYAQKLGKSVEEGARILRYQIFEEMGCDKIATAHSLSDCVETAIFNFARGTGITGLASIPPVRGKIIRPLIECSRAEIEAFLTERGVDWVTDSTNLTDDYTRNRIRHNIVPQLRQINPSLEKTMSGTLDNLREDAAFIKGMADELFESAYSGGGLDCAAIAAAHSSLSGRVVMRLLKEAGADTSREMVKRVRELCTTGGRISAGGGVEAYTSGGKLFAVNLNKGAQNEQTSVILHGDGNYKIFKKNILLNITDNLQNGSNIHKKVTNFIADYGKIKGEMVARGKLSGDKIKLIGRDFTSSVKNLAQAYAPPHERAKMVVITDDGGLIFVEGYGFAERVAVDNSTKTVLHCKIS